MTIKETNITGFAELQAFLDQLPVKIEANIMRGAMRAGCKPMLLAARENCPVGEPSGAGAKKFKFYAGALRDSIHIVSKNKGATVTASVKTGGKTKTGAKVWYARLIEFSGAVPHEITAKLGGSLFLGGMFRKSIHHPGMQPKPFMRPAFDSQSEAAILAAGEYIKDRLQTKEGLDVADIDLGVDQ